MRFRTVILLLCFLIPVSCRTVREPELRAFATDGCTCYPDGTLQAPDLWRPDCVAHDYAYWRGGSRAERREADRKLREGIREKGKPLAADVAFLGVRLGGTPFLPTPWRWGYGWNQFPRGYRAAEDRK
ncbi:MAG: hypothetical protein MI807_12395 [Verrucomicrobiales bacterium]|nr:hypothetical protein [Verrucomicrobiales bacterium]